MSQFSDDEKKLPNLLNRLTFEAMYEEIQENKTFMIYCFEISLVKRRFAVVEGNNSFRLN